MIQTGMRGPGWNEPEMWLSVQLSVWGSRPRLRQ
jgi:hypothetical protein